jgi:hypothetical protein
MIRLSLRPGRTTPSRFMALTCDSNRFTRKTCPRRRRRVREGSHPRLGIPTEGIFAGASSKTGPGNAQVFGSLLSRGSMEALCASQKDDDDSKTSQDAGDPNSATQPFDMVVERGSGSGHLSSFCPVLSSQLSQLP